MTNLSDLFPAGAGKQVSFVASGTLGNGVTVALKTDGTVEAISGATGSAGTPVVFETASTSEISATFDSDSNKVVIAYRDLGNSNYGTAIVGTVSGTAISFGTAVVFETASTSNISATFDSDSNKVVIAYRDVGNSNYGTAIVGTVSGTSISFGTAVVFETATSGYMSATFDSNENKVVIAYRDGGNSNYGTAIVGTVSGTSISFGTAVVFETANVTYLDATFDSTSDKVVIAYTDYGNSSYGTGIVGTVSGTAISFGTAVVFEAADTSYISSAFDTVAGKVVFAYTDIGNSYYGTAIVGTVSGTAISFGTPAVWKTDSTGANKSVVYDTNADKSIISYHDQNSTGDATVVVGTVTGTAIAFGSDVVVATGNCYEINSVYDSTNYKVVTLYYDYDNSSYGTAVVSSTAFTNNTSFVGITDAAISSAASGNVTVKGGISTNVTSLTPASDYYVQADGSISTVTTSPAVKLGRALSATSIDLEYQL